MFDEMLDRHPDCKDLLTHGLREYSPGSPAMRCPLTGMVNCRHCCFHSSAAILESRRRCC